jgi:uncharacterized repeat protein (TIGR03803 family)
VLHSFCSGGWPCTDGGLPNPSLIEMNGLLYGATGRGGANCQANGGCGTVFALDPRTGAASVLYSFCSQPNCADGDEPASGFIELNGKLYGATVRGGAYHDAGTVFALDPATGAESVVYSFCQTLNSVCQDGAGPGGLIEVDGKLYGAASAGGVAIVACQGGCGTVFEVDPATGAGKVLYAFCSQNLCKDGEYPGGLIHANGVFYGRTVEGGSYDSHHCYFGCGTVFSLARGAGPKP